MTKKQEEIIKQTKETMEFLKIMQAEENIDVVLDDNVINDMMESLDEVKE